MEISVEKIEGIITVLKVSGRIDTITAPDLDVAVGAALDSPGRACILELTAVDYVSSAGLRVLVMGAKKASSSGGVFSLCGVQPPVHKVLEMVGFAPLIETHTDEAGAVYAARKKLSI